MPRLSQPRLNPVLTWVRPKDTAQGSVVMLATLAKMERLRTLTWNREILCRQRLRWKQPHTGSWQYQPYRLHGQPIAVELQIVVNFTLQPQELET